MDDQTGDLSLPSTDDIMHNETKSTSNVDTEATPLYSPPANVPTTCTCYEVLHRQGERVERQSVDRPIPGCDHPDCPYRYLKRDSFTSEAFKIQLRNVHPYGGFKELKKLMNSRNVKYRKLKLLRDVSYLTFGSVEDRDAALTILDGMVWRGKKMEARVALGRADPLLKKRCLQSVGEVDLPATKRACPESENSASNELDEETRLRDAVTPLWRLEYEPDQLATKRETVLASLGTMRSKIIECNQSLKKILPFIKIENAKQPPICPLLKVIGSPVTTEYRNKSELTIGCDLQGNGPLIGFRFTKYRDGMTAVGSFKHVNILPKATISILESLQQFINQYCPAEPNQPLIAYDPITHRGHWRHVLVRETRLGDRLLLLDLYPHNLDKTAMDHVSDALYKWFCDDGPGKSVGLTSLYLGTRNSDSLKFDSSNTRLLFGKETVTELCCGLKFRISLNAFFQVNTLATELLYEQISQFIANPSSLSSNNAEQQVNETSATDIPKRQRILLDVCCGTGTIGLCLAKDFDRVIGIEMVPSAIEDAKQNALENGVENIQFFAGKAEDMMYDIINMLPDDADLVAVVDPPRAGLHTTVVQALRRCSRLQFIVFVACNLETAMHNFVEFARPTSNRFQGIPFVPVAAKAIDLFPQTRYVEVLLLLERARSIDQIAPKTCSSTTDA